MKKKLEKFTKKSLLFSQVDQKEDMAFFKKLPLLEAGFFLAEYSMIRWKHPFSFIRNTFISNI